MTTRQMIGMVSLCACLAVDPTAADRLPAAAGEVVLDSVNRLYLNPATGQVLLAGYFPTIDGISSPLFAGPPSEVTAHFTLFSESSGATVLQNGDVTASC
jgi:hypothetical protein